MRSTTYCDSVEGGYICGCHFARRMLQEFSSHFCASARFIPKRFVDLVRKWVTQCRNTADYVDRLILTLSDKIQAIFSN